MSSLGTLEIPTEREYLSTQNRKNFENNVFKCGQFFKEDAFVNLAGQLPRRLLSNNKILDFSECNLQSSSFEECTHSSHHNSFRAHQRSYEGLHYISSFNVIVFFGSDLRGTTWLPGLLQTESLDLEERTKKVCFFGNPQHSSRCYMRNKEIENEMYVNLYNSATKFPEDFNPRDHPKTWIRIEDSVSAEEAIKYVFSQLEEYQNRPQRKTLFNATFNVGEKVIEKLMDHSSIIIMCAGYILAGVCGLAMISAGSFSN